MALDNKVLPARTRSEKDGLIEFMNLREPSVLFVFVMLLDSAAQIACKQVKAGMHNKIGRFAVCRDQQTHKYSRAWTDKKGEFHTRPRGPIIEGEEESA